MTQINDPLFDGQAQDVPLDGFDRSDSARVLVYAKNPARPGYASALSIGQLGGGPGGGGATAPVATYPGQVLTMNAGEKALTVPAGANQALVTVTAGAALIGLNAATGAPSYAVGEGVQVSGAQLAALRLIQDGGATTVYVDYWQEA